MSTTTNPPPPSTGNGTGTGPVPQPNPQPFPNYPFNRYPYDRYPYSRYPPRDSNIPYWLYDRYGSYNQNYYPQTIVVPTVPAATVVAPAAITYTAPPADVSDAVSSFASLWPLLLSIAAALLLIILIFAAVMYVGRMIFSAVSPKPVVYTTTTAPGTVVV